MLHEVNEILEPERGGFFVDVTLGAGGHAEALLERAPAVRVLGVDRDPQALALARQRLSRFADRIELLEEDFGNLDQILGRFPPQTEFWRTWASPRCNSIGPSADFRFAATDRWTCEWAQAAGPPPTSCRRLRPKN